MTSKEIDPISSETRGWSRGLSRNVILTGCTSFFTDISSEMIYPLLQAFVSMILASQKALIGPVLGIIEGIAESTASLLKVYLGYYSDRIQKRKAPAIAGYGISAAAKLVLFLAALGWPLVLLARFLDRVGKGVRTAPRDAIIAESAPAETLGKSFGFHRAMDFAGATLGALFSFLLVLAFLDPVTRTLKNLNAFYIVISASVIPAAIGIVFLFFIRETGGRVRSGEKPRAVKPDLNIRHYDKNLQVFFLAQFIFTLGNSSNQFLLLRSMDLGQALSSVILMYLVFNLSTSALSIWFGSLSDRIGRKRVIMMGYGLYAAVYLSFGFISPTANWLLWVFWPLYGVYYAMTEGVEKAFVAHIAPEDSRATALGFYSALVGFGLLPASLIAGFLFALLPSAPFLFGGVTALTALLIMGVYIKSR